MALDRRWSVGILDGAKELNDTADSTKKTATAPQRCPRCRGPLFYQRCSTSEGVRGGNSCPICGYWQDINDPQTYRRPVKKRLDALVQCSVQGCTGMVQVSTTKTGRCTKCNRLMAEWERSAKTKPAPLIQVAGVWIFNPERKTLIGVGLGVGLSPGGGKE